MAYSFIYYLPIWSIMIIVNRQIIQTQSDSTLIQSSLSRYWNSYFKKILEFLIQLHNIFFYSNHLF